MEMLILIAAINIGVMLFLTMTGSKQNIESRTEREEIMLREANSKKGKL
jgi:hypothetical protein